jgi:Reeler domain
MKNCVASSGVGLTILLSFAAIIYAYATGPDPRYTGAPGDDPKACTSSGCHSDSALNSGSGNVVVSFPDGLTYTPGVQQTLTIVITDAVAKAWGFQMTARLDSDLSKGQAGDFTAGPGQFVLCDNSSFKGSKGCPANAPVQFIEHSNPFTTNTIKVTWTPPATNVGGIHIYVAAIAANKDGNDTGDHTYTANYALSGGPALALSRNTLNFGYSNSMITTPQPVDLNFTDIANATWVTSSDQPNIIVSSSSGNGNGSLLITANPGPSGAVTVMVPGTTLAPQRVDVFVRSVTPTLPLGSVDTPLDGTVGVVGAIPITGWALDNIEIAHVDIVREAVAGEPTGKLIPIGNAVFVADARPDVQTTFPTYPYQYRGGWGYQMLTNFLLNSSGTGPLGNGTYKLHASAFNKAGNQLDLGTKTITVDNAHATKPFGTIDTPGQGETISGADYVNFGWALTPQPGIIPMDGSTITVVIDGVVVGHPTYGQFRSDISTLFPGYANSGGAVGFFHIDTTKLANGVHTISWNVFDNLGRGEGLGSRYFTVLNTGTPAAAAPEDVIDQPVAVQGARVRHGLSRNRQPADMPQDGDGSYTVTMEEVGLIDLHLGATSGTMLVAGEQHALPAGSTLKGGVFYWQPGPGALGDFTMQFARPDGTTIPVRVTIVPKRFSVQ